jgi:hypothetical protein
MRQHPWVGIVVAVSVIAGLAGSGYAAAGAPALATERWQASADSGTDKGVWTLSKNADGQVAVSGVWTYMATVTCPFTGGNVKFSGPVFSFIATGTATNTDAPPGYQESPFTLEVKGEAAGGRGSGSYAIHFSTAGWPQDFSGKWQATRAAGTGITD